MDAKALDNVGTNVPSTQTDSGAEHTDTESRYFSFPNGVTIEMHDHIHIRATKLHVMSHGYKWADELGRVVLEHKLRNLRTKYIPWKRARQGNPMIVDFAKNELHECEVQCLNRCVRRHQVTIPSYAFSNSTDYGLFQSAIRNKIFIRDYEATSINCKGSVPTQGNRKQCIKFWTAILSPSEVTLTIPFSVSDNGSFKIEHLDISPYWMKWDTVKSKGVKAIFIRIPPSSPPGSFQSTPRRFSFKLTESISRSRTSASTNLPLHDMAPAQIAQRWKHIEIEFANKEGTVSPFCIPTQLTCHS